MTYCTPYLLQLGLTKSKLSMVWIAGPLSGLIMQPVVGILADKSTSKWGRRRPIMIAGTVLVSLCLFVLGWTPEIVGLFVSDEALRRKATIVLAVFSIYALDFAINAVQASCRSLVVDSLPASKQQLGSAWASRMASIGHLIGYGIGAVNLSAIFGTTLGSTQFKQLCVIAALALIAAVGVTSWAVHERVLVHNGEDNEQPNGLVSTLSQIYQTTRNLPARIQAICWVQFWAWIGWFPFLFYSSTWVGEIYLRYDAPHAIQNKDTLGDVGRLGSSALIVFSMVTFTGSWVIPWLVKSPEDEQPGFTPRPPASIAPVVKVVSKFRPSLSVAWTISHLIFAMSMAFAPFVTSFRQATLLIAICGVPSTLANWAPFTFMGVEINKLPSTKPRSEGPNHQQSIELSSNSDTTSQTSSTRAHDSSSAAPTSELAGIYLGILNLYTTLPQFVATGVSTIVFSVLEPGKSPELAKDAHPDEHHGTDGYNGIAVCLFIGAVSAIVAAHATRRLKHIA
ncbi:hypothetical protein AAFC00_002938 [Neodothiora populina]|uniref:Sucrose transport protein n=1 Tax=Neodothiora populina TaxID=2781224 RepID=A0ABR3PA25_9PEZI